MSASFASTPSSPELPPVAVPSASVAISVPPSLIANESSLAATSDTVQLSVASPANGDCPASCIPEFAAVNVMT